MKKLLMAALLCCFVGTVQAYQNATYQLVVDSQAVAGTATIYSGAILVGPYSDVSFIFTLHGTTVTADVKLTVQVIDSNTSNYSVIGSTNDTSVDANYDVSYSTNNYVMSWTDLVSNGTLVASLTSGKIANGFSLPVARWFRFAITGNATNEVTPGRVIVSVTFGRYSER